MADGQTVNIQADPTPANAPAQRPDNVPEKFWDAEKGSVNTDALLKSYVELEKMKAAPKTEQQPSQEQQTQSSEQKTEEEQKVEEAVEDAGLKIEDLEAEIAKDGKLSDASYEKLAKAGFSKEFVDGVVADRVASAERQRAEIVGLVGGEEQFNKMAEWASKNWSEAQAQEYNDAVNSGNRGRIEIAMKALKADFTKANGQVPNLLNGVTGTSPAGGSFASLQQLLDAQKDPRYAKDPAYRAEVEAKLARSSFYKAA